jgi:hypothetical protein
MLAIDIITASILTLTFPNNNSMLFPCQQVVFLINIFNTTGPNFESAIRNFLCINQHSLFCNLKLTYITWYSYGFIEPSFPSQHPPSGLCVAAILTNIGGNHISLHHFIHCLSSPATFYLQQTTSCHPPSMSRNGKYSDICHIQIKSCFVHAKSHVSLHSQLLCHQHLSQNDLCHTLWLNSGNPGT